MDYKKEYKEAFALMKDCIPDENGLVHVRPDDIFPELKESEDEKIRKALKEYFINSFQNNGVAAICGVHIKDILAWLEKQKGTEREIEGNSLCKGEQNPVVPRFRVGDTIRNKKTNRLFYVHHLSEAGFLSLSDTNKTVYQGYLSENDFENYELVEQKPAEWSEEDETTKNNISHIIRQYDKISKRENQPCSYIGDCLLWMQNIKDRCLHQKQWKPSEEQMEALDEARSLANNCGEESAFDLRTLHEQLKKLREE